MTDTSPTVSRVRRLVTLAKAKGWEFRTNRTPETWDTDFDPETIGPDSSVYLRHPLVARVVDELGGGYSGRERLRRDVIQSAWQADQEDRFIEIDGVRLAYRQYRNSDAALWSDNWDELERLSGHTYTISLIDGKLDFVSRGRTDSTLRDLTEILGEATIETIPDIPAARRHRTATETLDKMPALIAAAQAELASLRLHQETLRAQADEWDPRYFG